MPNANINQQGAYFYYDPAVLPSWSDVFTQKSGTIAVTTSALTLSPATGAFQLWTKPSFVVGIFRVILALVVPSATAGYTFGLLPSMGSDINSCYFKTETDGTLSCVSHNEAGTEQKTNLAWEAGWTGTATIFTINNLNDGTIEFLVNNIRRAVHSTYVPKPEPRHFQITMSGVASSASLTLLDIRSSDIMIINYSSGGGGTASNPSIVDVQKLGGGSIQSGQTSPFTATAGLQNNLPVAQYQTSPATAVNGNVVANQCDQYGNQKVAQAYLPYGSDPVLSRQGVMEKRDTVIRTTTALQQILKPSAAADVVVIPNAILTGTVRVYNSPSTTANLIAEVPAGTVLPFRIGVNFPNGVTYVTSAADAVTVACN